MRIAHIILTSQNGGAEQVFVDYVRILKKIGHHNFSIIKNNAPYANQLENNSEEILKISNNFGYHDIFAIEKIKKFLIKNQIDIVIAHAGRAMVLANKAIKKVPSKIIILVAVNHSNNVKRSLCADLILSINKEICYKTIDLKRTPENSLILYNGIAVPKIDEFPVTNFANQEIINLGVIGRGDKNKGFDFAIKALKILKDKIPEKKFRLYVAGDGEEMTNLKALTRSLKLENEVIFLGWVHNKHEFYEKIDIFILPSHNETFGLVILEAMKNFKPIIATKCDGPLEILRDNVDGFLIDLKNPDLIPENIAVNVEKIIGDDKASSLMIQSAFARLDLRYSFNTLERNLAEIFKTKIK
ncbi:MAG: glycosyltransferase [Alphaproteobacteria bacterium]